MFLKESVIRKLILERSNKRIKRVSKGVYAQLDEVVEQVIVGAAGDRPSFLNESAIKKKVGGKVNPALFGEIETAVNETLARIIKQSGKVAEPAYSPEELRSMGVGPRRKR